MGSGSSQANSRPGVVNVSDTSRGATPGARALQSTQSKAATTQKTSAEPSKNGTQPQGKTQQDKAPDPAPKKGQAPDPAPKKDKAPDPAPKKDQAPDPAPKKDKAPDPAPKKDQAPDPAPKNDKAPDPAPKKGQAPDPAPKKNKAPDPAPKKDQAPDPAPKKDKAPDSAPKKDQAPDPAPKKDKAPDPAPKKDNALKTQKELNKEADDILKTQLKLFAQTKVLKSKAKDLTAAVLRDHVKAVRKSYTSFDGLPYDLATTYKGKLSSPFTDTGTMAFVCDTLIDGFEKNSYIVTTTTTETKEADKKGEQTVDKDQSDLLHECVLALSTFSSIQSVVRKMVKRPGFISGLLQKLDHMCQPHLHGTAVAIESKYVIVSITLLFKMTSITEDDHIKIIRSQKGFFEILKKYLSSKQGDVRLTSIAALAAMVTEKEAETIAAESDIVKFLMKQLEEAINSEKKNSKHGWTIAGLTRVIKALARNDANKQLLVKEGAVPLLTTVLKPEYQKGAKNTERERTLGCLWWLSFDAQNREVMIKNEELMDFVVNIYKQGPKKNSHYSEAEGFLFQMRHTMRENNKYKEIASKLLNEKDKTEDTANTTSGHVMLSYQTEHRPVVKATCEFLKKQGFSMWMDIYNMAEGEESTLQTMAEAVQESSVVIVCFSDSYKNSLYCRAEAEYAFMRGKTIIPLKLEKGYSPDGWLGIILGSKFFYDFTKEGKELQDKRQKLLEAVQKAYALEAETSDGKKATAKPGAAAATPKSTMNFEDKVKTWTKKDVDAWRTKFNLKGKEVEALSAEEIIYLYNLKSEAPAVFHASVGEQLALTSISGKASFNKALDQLPDVAAEMSQ